MIRVSNLTKQFGRKVAVDNLSFEVERGEILGFLGPNGAGKTTTMRILSCFMPATGGTVRIDGMDVFRNSLEVRRKIGYMPENVVIYPEMRVVEYLRYRARLKGVARSEVNGRVEDVIRQCGLLEVRRTLVGKLSKGFNQRVGLADALVHNPDVLILDEPTIGLDPNQIRQVRHLIKGLAPQHTVILCSHILPEVEMVCSRVLIINRGRIVASDTPSNLVSLMRGDHRLILEVNAIAEAVEVMLKDLPGIRQVRRAGNETGEWSRLICECEKGVDVRPDIFRAVARAGWVLRELSIERRNLEDVFVSVTTRDTSSD